MVNKVSLEPNHAHSFPYCLRLLSYSGRVVVKETACPSRPKIFTIWPVEKIPDPWSRRSQIKMDPWDVWKRNSTRTATQIRVHTLGSYIAKSTHRSGVGTGRILISASALHGHREVKCALIQMISNKHIFKARLITTPHPRIRMGTGSEQRIYTVYVRISEPDSPQDDSVENCLSACSK